MSRPRRTTQLRARFLIGTDMRVVWVVTDPGRTLDDLKRDARRDLGNVLVAAHVQATDAEHWHTADGDAGSIWLVADLRVKPWQDPVRDHTRRATTPADN